MPICTIDGPAGLSQHAKQKLIKATLATLVGTYHMPDDRVFLKENDVSNVGHTSYEDDTLIIHGQKPRPVCVFHAPQGLPLESKRKLMSEMTDHLAEAYDIKDRRDILIFIQEYALDVVANNGYLQSENPEFASPATL